MRYLCTAMAFLGICGPVWGAAEISTNNIYFPSPPPWLTVKMVETATARVQNIMEWDTIKVTAYYYTDEQAFENVHHLGPLVDAFFRQADKCIYLGPRINTGNFEQVFGHELTHVIVYQKYKDSIPPWLEEGLANYVSQNYQNIDYAWLAAQPAHDITKMGHAFQGPVDPRYHYPASTAVMQMIAAKCPLRDLLQLSVGKKMETYLTNFCEISDVNAEFQKWLQAKAARKTATKS